MAILVDIVSIAASVPASPIEKSFPSPPFTPQGALWTSTCLRSLLIKSGQLLRAAGGDSARKVQKGSSRHYARNYLAQHETVKVKAVAAQRGLAENSAKYLDSAWKFSSSSVERPSTHELYRY